MYDSVLFPTNGSEGSASALDHALELAADQDATLHVLHAIEIVAPATSLHEMIAERMKEKGEKLVNAVAEEGSERGIIVKTAVLAECRR